MTKLNICYYTLGALLLCIGHFAHLAHSQSSTAQSTCASKSTCSKCIQTVGCAWCLDADLKNDRSRCFSHALKDSSGCVSIYFPVTFFAMLDKASLSETSYSKGGYETGGSISAGSSGSGSYHEHGHGESGASGSGGAAGGGSGSIVQIYPQRVNLKLRINEKHRMDFRYRQAEDYPVDLYYLMDLSKSMDDDRKKLSELGSLLTQKMRSLTRNFRLGFGSFVDKVLMPYVSTVPANLISPCTDCTAPYGFINSMPLSTEAERFTTEVAKAKVSGNLDAPEGGFDAIMQAVVCGPQIGWRNQSRRLLVFSTDAGFHYAGDGKLGGVITPNDGECHMEDNEYTYSKIQDYPSISQVNWKVKEKAINVIFAVTEQQHDVYKKLSAHIEGSSSAILSNDSSNVVDLVEKEYNKITSAVEMKDNSNEYVKITYYSKCLTNGEEIQTNKCEGLKTGSTVEFTAEIVVISCPGNQSEWKQAIEIYPVGIQEKLIVELEMICDCECEHTQITELSDKCRNHGKLKCGICECTGTYFGRNCECSPDSNEAQLDLTKSNCRRDNSSLMDCSGHGICSCNQCECDSGYGGVHCECDNTNCHKDESGVLCSGHGKCNCGNCECDADWTKMDCSCSMLKDKCMNRETNTECSGHGKCECGVCKCDISEGARYSGTYCERCPTCAGRCVEFRDCVQCLAYQTGPLKDNDVCIQNCTTNVNVQSLEDKVEAREDLDEHLCTFYDDEDCKYQFVYTETEPDKVHIRAQKNRECPPQVVILGIVLAVIAAIVLIGLAVLLMWKLFTTIHDRREFARFEKERMMAKWDTGENPIYKQATTTFKNPTYAGK